MKWTHPAAGGLAAPANRPGEQSGRVSFVGLPAIIRRFYEEQAGLKPGDLVVLGVSGGVDSMRLAHASLETAGETGLTFLIAHFDHDLHQDSAANADFVRRYAADMGVEFELGTGRVKVLARERRLGVEEAARELRYQFLHAVRVRSAARFVAVAHTRDDQAETVLLRLIRGAGLRGLTAMQPVGPSVIRPLLEIEREKIERYPAGAGLEHRDDPTNEQMLADRNQIRHIVMPALRAIRPGVQSVLARTADTLGSELEVIEWAAREALEHCEPDEFGDVLELSQEGLAKFPKGVIAAVLRLIAEERSGEFPPRAVVDAAIAFCREPRSGGSVPLGNSLWILRSKGRLAFAPAPDWQATLGNPVTLPVPGTVEFPKVGLGISARVIEDADARREMALIAGEHHRDPCTATLDLDCLVGPFTVRSGSAEDVFPPYGHESAKSLVHFLSRRQVPFWRRNLAPVLIADERIAWVAGFEIGDFCQVVPGSRRLLKLRLES